ncbi:MAG: excinuclease ABC subunit UvrC [Gemmatimonadales bacterium]|nr:excinuclease ABC subunit UvrC [Gemmatimonadales bacterium]MBT3958191.1 excinuclease ABC subunit UvrC [Gemmatimonadales bacterium]MBT4187155.1 excinuclease ABC subunit UvrC [Gemmatimonadales bacterium]MBT4439286.1 excinuclease ABC subunit UvrC [Gemmatimonadales bacterium]MBT5046128.1 excinuclease ABC subunit UvrC [Gemmatimonadales bacterium]
MPVTPAILKALARKPGVYLFRDTGGAVLYVGKAKVLRSRVRSYFQREVDLSPKNRELVRLIDSVETLVVGTEAEALILEANLIKEHKPRFNILMRDDKKYPYIKVTVREPFPRVYVTRRVINDGARYFGPYTAVGPMRQALEVVKRLHTVRSCRYNLPKDRPERACLDYHIGRCKAPCVGLQSEADYRGMVDEILRILEGDTEQLRGDVEVRMHEASSELDFEQAAQMRDVIAGLDALANEQRVHNAQGGDLDIVALARDGDLGAGVVLKVRSGLLLGRSAQRFAQIMDESDEDILSSLVSRHYLGTGEAGMVDLPRQVLLPGSFADGELLAEILSEASGRKVAVLEPQRGEKRRLIELAEENARQVLEDKVAAMSYAADRADDALFSLQDELDLKVVPRLMVCFDVSHMQGSDTVASAVVFENGEPRRAAYRHMRIKGEWGNDDYASMEEAVQRYFRRRRDEEKPLPDLAVVDGGKGQLSAAVGALASLGLGDVAVIALAKREEEVFMPGSSDPVLLDRRNRALHLLQRIRDEAHRFAVRYNRKLRKKHTIRSDLGEIPGIGPQRQRTLLRRFGSLKGVKEATKEEISRVPGFSQALASRILTYLGR